MCAWVATAAFGIAAVFEFQFLTSGHLPDKGIAIVCLVFGVIFFLGSFTMGLERRPYDAEDDTW